MTPEQLDELKRDEGLALKVYDDATGLAIGPGSVLAGHPTIGYGRTLDIHGITEAEANCMLVATVAQNRTELIKLPWFNGLDLVRQGVIANLAYNMGVAGVKGFVRMIGFLRAGQFDLAATQLAASKWATQVQKSRSQRLIAQLRTGQI